MVGVGRPASQQLKGVVRADLVAGHQDAFGLFDDRQGVEPGPQTGVLLHETSQVENVSVGIERTVGPVVEMVPVSVQLSVDIVLDVPRELAVDLAISAWGSIRDWR